MGRAARLVAAASQKKVPAYIGGLSLLVIGVVLGAVVAALAILLIYVFADAAQLRDTWPWVLGFLSLGGGIVGLGAGWKLGHSAHRKAAGVHQNLLEQGLALEAQMKDSSGVDVRNDRNRGLKDINTIKAQLAPGGALRTAVTAQVQDAAKKKASEAAAKYLGSDVAAAAEAAIEHATDAASA